MPARLVQAEHRADAAQVEHLRRQIAHGHVAESQRLDRGMGEPGRLAASEVGALGAEQRDAGRPGKGRVQDHFGPACVKQETDFCAAVHPSCEDRQRLHLHERQANRLRPVDLV